MIISTTGKASRELFEYRAATGGTHARDFLTVGSMGHASSIALAVALYQPGRRVWCLDGDGAALMHLGALPVIASRQPGNLIHVLINNQCHETVGGMPTVADSADLPALARASGYKTVLRAENAEELAAALDALKAAPGPSFLEVMSNSGARADLGRPTNSAMENKQHFMEYRRKNND